MPLNTRHLYRSPNGDQWFLCQDPAAGSVFIRREANLSSGGQVTDTDIETFLTGGERHPQHQALIRLIGTLVEPSPPASKADRRKRT